MCAIWLHLCLKRVPRSWFSGGGTLAKTAHFLSESILGWVRFLSTEIGSGHIDSRALIRQIDKVLRGIDVFLHESERVPIRFIITSLDSMTIAFYLSTFIGDALWSRSIRWNIKSFPIIHLAPSLLPVFLLGVRGVIEALRTILDVLKRGQSLDDAILNWNWAFPTVPTLMRSCVSTSGFVRGNRRKAVFAFK